jgi:hypothetical protein
VPENVILLKIKKADAFLMFSKESILFNKNLCNALPSGYLARNSRIESIRAFGFSLHSFQK